MLLMEYEQILKDKALKPKEKTELLSRLLLDNPLIVNEFVSFAATCKDPDKATCIEALEFATIKKPEIATKACFDLVTIGLTAKAPRVKWESARVVGNIAHLFPESLDEVIVNLLANTEHPGTVVRWSAATAMGQILKLKTKINAELFPAIDAILAREEKNSIRKIYLEAIKKAGK